MVLDVVNDAGNDAGNDAVIAKMSIYVIRDKLTFACTHAIEPCAIKLRIPRISAPFEPSTTTSAAAEFAGFLDGSTFGAYASGRSYGCRRGCC